MFVLIAKIMVLFNNDKNILFILYINIYLYIIYTNIIQY